MPEPYEHLALLALRAAGFRSRRVPTRLGPLHALEGRGRGALPPTVLLHGLGSTGVHYGGLLRRLRPRVRRLIAPDFPAHGFSGRPWRQVTPEELVGSMTDALDALIAPGEPAVLFGNSLGGWAAVRYAVDRPERVAALVLLSPAGAPTAASELDALRGLFDFGDHDAALGFLDRVFARPPAMRHVMAAELRRRFAKPELRALLRAVGPEHSLRAEELEGLRMPVLLVWGAGDRLLPDSHRRFYRAHLPGHAWVEEPREVGHSPYLERPDEVAASTLRFLGSVAKRAPGAYPGAHERA